MRTVAIFGSARIDSTKPLFRETVEAARLLAQNGWTIATGGGPGLMEAANVGAKSACEGATCSLGYSICLPFESSANSSMQLDSNHNNLFSRLKQFTDDCDAFIALPGGYGTLLEVTAVIQSIKTKHIENKPLILVGSMWHDIMTYASNRFWRDRFISDNEQYFWWNTTTVLEAAERLIKMK